MREPCYTQEKKKPTAASQHLVYTGCTTYRQDESPVSNRTPEVGSFRASFAIDPRAEPGCHGAGTGELQNRAARFLRCLLKDGSRSVNASELEK